MAKILLIEDNEFLSRMYENIFNFEHYEVFVAGNGEEGIKKAAEILPDLILLDVIMPKMNGIEALEHLKSDPKTKNIPVVMLTVAYEDETIEKCFQLGANGYLIKSSINPDQILSEVKNYLAPKTEPPHT